MAEEQPIYLSPEDNITNVRERLRKTANRRIVLVVPAETQLRSHVSWRLLHDTARDLGKDIFIVSPDRQIRSVAKAVGFRAADLQASPTTAKSRGGSSPSRLGLGGKTSPHLRTPPTKGSAPRQNIPPVKDNANEQGTPPVMGNTPAQGNNAPAGKDIPLKNQNDQITRQPKQEDISTGWAIPPLSSAYDPDDYSLGPSSNIQPLGSSYVDEEPDFFLEDVRHAQSLREAAQPLEADTTITTTGAPVPPQETPKIIDLSSKSAEVDDPLSNMIDDHPSSLPEQRGGVIFHHPDDEAVDISEEPTSVLHIEDLGDSDEEFYNLPGSATLAWSGEEPDEEQDIPGPSRVHGVRRRASRTGGMRPAQVPRQDLDAEDVKLPPVNDQRPRLSPYSESASYPAAGRTPPVTRTPPVRGTQPRPAPAPMPQTKRPYVAPVAQAPRPAPKTTPPPPKARKPRKKSRGNVGLGVAGLLSILVLFVIGLLAYLGPTADLTVTLRSHSYPLQLELTASSTSHLDVLHHTIPAQTLAHDISVSGTGHASGTTTVGTVQATGTVVFTNNSSGPVVIPNGTIVATKNNVQFVTQAEVLVPSGNSNNPALTLVQAQIAGTGGNVPAGSIIVIPNDGLNRIQQANPTVSNLNLTVNNPSATTGGGAGSAATVTNQDVTTLKQQLDLQLQAEVTDYVKKNTQANDVLGKIMQAESQPVVTPPVNSIVTSGTFLMTIKLTLSVLVVKATTIQAASTAEINAALSKQNIGMTLVPQQIPETTKMKSTPSADGNSIKLSYTTIGQVAPQVPEDTVRQLVSGKSAADAKSALTTGSAAIPDVVKTDVTISPSFVSWVTFYLPHITVHYKAVPQPPTKK